ncbi:GNAT family N-acetyltransferase [Streptomyces ficellus]|uniref:GNAT family N-acetyltransferase n=1 Tax=Streptomyces ficellus TaxID=1977088 RepID=A0A6I6FHS2_9ACTN|nr:GNAT family N-acetyltransferase [Streptomyces ficellus]QGV78605.1 GNAT family N-acetyltransferase [Streptomyces ficellus]
MDSATITSAWVAGWTVSRGTPAAVEEPWGYRIDVGLPHHVFRHVLPEPDEVSVRKLCENVTEPGAWLKILAAPERAAGWITPGWTVPDDPGFMMFTALRATAAPALPDGYATETATRDGVYRVRILAPDGTLAARGQIAPTGATAVVDQVETYDGHRRRGLGRAVLRTLETAGARAGATTGVLAATTDGRALYGALGWRYQGPLTGIVRSADRDRTEPGKGS